jgi:hypothetical protein
MLTFEPIQDSDLPAIGEFLHQHHDSTRSPASWAALFRYPWEAGKPNNGFQLRDRGTLAGVVGAIYSRQKIRGESHTFCNITSWAVMESHRSHSTRLLHTCLSQPGLHFTNFSPMPVVENILKFLKFTVLDDSYYVTPSVPAWPRTKVMDATEENLTGTHREVFRDHRGLRGLIHLSVDSTYVALTRDRVKGLPAAEVLHAGDPATFTRGAASISAHLLKQSLFFLKAERRFTTAAPPWSSLRPMSPPKYFRSDRFSPAEITTLYSERVLLTPNS